MAARREEGSVQGLYLAAEAGHNGKSHNHNDVGNFLVYADGAPAIIDVGVETYTARTFSPQRYDIWTMQSAYHNCPTIGGVMQSAGREFAATEVSYRADDRQAELSMNIAKAYPATAHLAAWRRALRLDRVNNTIEVVDDYRLTESAHTITLTLMTPCAAQLQTAGEITLPMPSGRPLLIAYDGAALRARVEEIPIEDARLRESWGERLYRVQLHADTPPLGAKWTLRISQ